MITLLLLRHCKASVAGPGLADHDRPISARGRESGAIMARHIRDLPIRPSLVLCSTARRARETLEAIRDALPSDVVVRHESAMYGGGAGAIVDLLRRHGARHAAVLVAGHNPDIQTLALSLAGDGEADAMGRVRSKYPTGGLAILVGKDRTWSELAPGSLRLRSFVVPKDLVPQDQGS